MEKRDLMNYTINAQWLHAPVLLDALDDLYGDPAARPPELRIMNRCENEKG